MEAIRKNMKDQPKAILLEVPSDSDLPVRLEKISEQTGLAFLSLLQKWILQEEFFIGVVQRNKEPAPKRAAARPGVSKRAKTAQSGPGNPEYRKELIKKAMKLKKDGMTLKKIAATFNEKKVSTVSGVGKWYASSINNLLNPKK